MIIYGGYSWCEKKTAHDENPSNNLRCGVEEGVEYKTDVNLCLNQIQIQIHFFVVRLYDVRSKDLSYHVHVKCW